MSEFYVQWTATHCIWNAVDIVTYTAGGGGVA